MVRTLPSLAGLEIRARDILLRRKPNPISTYRELLQGSKASVIAGASAADFQRKFNGFYGVRRNAFWRSHFYELFEAAKASDQPHQQLFEAVLSDLYSRTDRVEASFASKLVATLRPNAPIIDSIVVRFIAGHLPKPTFTRAPENATAFYIQLDEILRDLLVTPQAQAWSEWFDQAFPTPTDGVAVSPTKKLDFLIWSGTDSQRGSLAR